MDTTLLPTILSAVGGLCCCLFWIALLVGAIWFFMRRGKGGDEPGASSRASIDEKLSDNMSSENKASDAAANEPAMAAPGPVESEDPEDAATVIAPQPPRPGDAPPTPPKAAPPKPRTSGATIIAFDDDLADDE